MSFRSSFMVSRVHNWFRTIHKNWTYRSLKPGFVKTNSSQCNPILVLLNFVLLKTHTTLSTNEMHKLNHRALATHFFSSIRQFACFFLTCHWPVVIFCFTVIGCCDYLDLCLIFEAVLVSWLLQKHFCEFQNQELIKVN